MTYEEIVREQIERSGRPLHPTWKDGQLDDPTARDFEKDDGEVISARERTSMSMLGQHAIEGFWGTLTPLGFILVADACLQFLAATDEQVEGGYFGVSADPWGEVRHLPADVREEFGRAGWHLEQALSKLGLLEADPDV